MIVFSLSSNVCLTSRVIEDQLFFFNNIFISIPAKVFVLKAGVENLFRVDNIDKGAIEVSVEFSRLEAWLVTFKEVLFFNIPGLKPHDFFPG